MAYLWHGLVLTDKHGNVQGTVFEIPYDTAEKTSFTIRLAIDQEYEGRNLGFQVMMYSCLLAWEKGSRVKRGDHPMQKPSELIPKPK